MKRLLLLAALCGGCRPAESASENSPPPEEQGRPTPTDSARADALLERADRARIQGAATAPVWLVEVSDFECPFCKQWHDETYPAIRREFIVPGHVRMAYVNFPLQRHVHALPTAEAAMCAGAQDKFWPMHDALFATQAHWTPLADGSAMFDSLARVIGVDVPAWRDCLRSKVMQRLIGADRARGETAGATSTPFFFVGDEVIRGAAPIEVFRASISRARAKVAARARP